MPKLSRLHDSLTSRLLETGKYEPPAAYSGDPRPQRRQSHQYLAYILAGIVACMALEYVHDQYATSPTEIKSRDEFPPHTTSPSLDHYPLDHDSQSRK